MILRRSLFRMGVEIASLHTSVRLRHVVHRIVQTNSIGKNRDLSWKLRTPDRFFDFWYGGKSFLRCAAASLPHLVHTE